ncbi:hypothetical protein LCGC14_0721710 [marine sediment metagenome]|uniref:Dipeptidylpeptidase IV N-terminal domain-containing protein n=1 Tax=marine sediment metagenome TaxID=412755 RepID=A0A0F9QGE7_9ZZZZ
MLGLSKWGGKEQRILHVISVSGGEATEILNTYRYAWSPDSKELALLSRSAGYGKNWMPF